MPPLGRVMALPGSGAALGSGAMPGSLRSTLRMEKHSPIRTITNGAAEAMATACKAERATSTEPWIAPAKRQIAAAAPVKTPHTMMLHLLGCRLPRLESIPITTEAASAPLTKNRATRMIVISAVSPNSGNCSRVRNNAPGWLLAAVLAREFTAPESCRLMAVPPKTANHTKLTTLGARITPETNSRIVRPLEMRAIKVPTNGAHEIHQAQ